MSAILVVTLWWLKTAKLQIYGGSCNKMLILAVYSTTQLTNQIQETNIYPKVYYEYCFVMIFAPHPGNFLL